jgi:hypothetical protein
LHVIALNFSDDTVGGRRIEVGGTTGRAKLAWESREVELVGGAITDSFGPYDVKVYDILVTK